MRQTLASDGIVRVERCSCGAVHLAIGAVTLRLEASAIEPIAAVLEQAAHALSLESRFAAFRRGSEASA